MISTVVGSGVSGYSGDGGQATMAALWNPFKVFVTTSSVFFIADWQNNRVRKVSQGIGCGRAVSSDVARH